MTVQDYPPTPVTTRKNRKKYRVKEGDLLKVALAAPEDDVQSVVEAIFLVIVADAAFSILFSLLRI